MKIRQFKEKNYKSIYHNGKTLRIALDSNKPIKELDYPEFYDVKITDFCTGNCPWCYQDSTECGKHFENVLEKIDDFFGNMSKNERPFQVALGGGNPNQHPQFDKILEKFDKLDITPNYTTNGIGITDKIVKLTKKYCGGVAVSCHSHLFKEWTEAVNKLLDNEIRVNLHIIISDKTSIDEFKNYYDMYNKDVDYFVLLPHIQQGRAKNKQIDYKYLTKTLCEIDNSKVAFGANFYNYLCDNRSVFNVSLYEPESMSKYLDMSNMILYNSSFNLEIWKDLNKK